MTVDARWELRLLGHPELRCDDGRLVDLPMKTFAIAAHLVLDRPNQQCSRSELAAFLWSDADSTHQRTNLRTLLKRIRSGIDGSTTSPFAIDGEIIALDPDAVYCDLSEFQRLLVRGEASDVVKAAALFSGELIETRDRGSAAFERWLRDQRSSLSQAFRAAASRALESDDLNALPEKKEALARRLIEEDQNDEASHRALIRIYASRGDFERVRSTYDNLAHNLRMEHGCEPSHETRALYRSLATRVDEAADPSPSYAHESDTGGWSPSAPFISVESRGPVLLVPSALSADGGSAVGPSTDIFDCLLMQLWKQHSLRIVLINRDHSRFEIAQSAGDATVYRLHFGTRAAGIARCSARLVFEPTSDLLWADSFLPTDQHHDQIAARFADAIVGAIENHQIREENLRPGKQRTSFTLVARAERALMNIDLTSMRGARRMLRTAARMTANPFRAQAKLARTFWMEWLLGAGRDRALLMTSRDLARSALAAQPDSHYAHQELGMTALCLGQRQRALEHLSEAHNLSPFDSQLQIDFAYALIANGQAKEALSSLEAGGLTECRFGGFSNWVTARAHYALGEYEDAILDLLELPIPAAANRLLAVCYALLDERENAEEAKDKYLAANPNFSLDRWLSQCPLRSRVDVSLLREGLLIAGFH